MPDHNSSAVSVGWRIDSDIRPGCPHSSKEEAREVAVTEVVTAIALGIVQTRALVASQASSPVPVD